MATGLAKPQPGRQPASAETTQVIRVIIADSEAIFRVGIRKVNISTEIHAAFTRAIQEARGNDPRPALRADRAAVALVAQQADVGGVVERGRHATGLLVVARPEVAPLRGILAAARLHSSV